MVPLASVEIEFFLWDESFDAKSLIKLVFDQIRNTWPHVPGGSRLGGSTAGIFLPGGERVYLDTSSRCAHLEIALPLFSNISRLIDAYVQAFDLVRHACVETATRRDIDVRLFATNACYSPPGTTFGLHENFTFRGEALPFVRTMASLQVALSQVCGAGGFESRFPSFRFLESPRKTYICRVTGSSTSSGQRALVDTYDARPYGRIQRRQLIAGDQVHPRYAHQLWLRLAVTRAFVSLIEQGVELDRTRQLAIPLEALHAADDVHPNPQVLLASKKRTSLREFQDSLRAFLVDRIDLLPCEIREETAAACQLWTSLLAAIDADTSQVHGLLSWKDQLRMLQQFAIHEGTDWQELRIVERSLDHSHASATQISTGPRVLAGHTADRMKGITQPVPHELSPQRTEEVIALLPRFQYVSALWHEVGPNIFCQAKSDCGVDDRMPHESVGYQGSVCREIERCKLIETHTEDPQARCNWDSFEVGLAEYQWSDPWAASELNFRQAYPRQPNRYCVFRNT